MAKHSILEYPHPLLRKKSKPVEEFDQELTTLVEKLFATLAQGGGIGLSAPQLGELVQVLVVHVPDDEFGAQVYVNPEIVSSSTLGLVEEGCLSLPGIVANVIRATQIRVRAYDAHGNPFERDVTGMHAVCLQHEMDHLEGKLFIDRLSWIRRLQINYQLKKLQKAA